MITQLLDWISQPVGALWTCLTGSLILVCNYRTRLVGRLSLLLCIAAFWALSAAGPTNALINHVESLRVEPPGCPHARAAVPVVILSGGLDAWTPSTNAYEVLNRDSLLRALHATKVATPDTPVYMIGRGSAHRDITPLMRQVLIDGGIDPAQILDESYSASTIENARAFARLSPVAASPSITLVTSLWHAWRAAAVFEAQGYIVCVQATDRQFAPAAGFTRFLPYIAGLNKSTLALRELLAIGLYRLRGYL